MWGARLLLPILAALAVSACMRQQQTYYVVDPNTGQQMPVVTQQQFAQPQYAQQPNQPPATPASDQRDARGLFSSSPGYAQQAYAEQRYQQPVAQPPTEPSSGRGIFTSRSSYAPQVYAQPQPQPPAVVQYSAPQYAQPQYAAPQVVPQGGPSVAAP
jgi:hypothetical protein